MVEAKPATNDARIDVFFIDLVYSLKKMPATSVPHAVAKSDIRISFTVFHFLNRAGPFSAMRHWISYNLANLRARKASAPAADFSSLSPTIFSMILFVGMMPRRVQGKTEI